MDPSVKKVFSKVIKDNHITIDNDLIEWIKSHLGYLNYEQTIVVKDRWHTISK